MSKDKKENNKSFRDKNPYYQPYYRYKKKCIESGEKPIGFAEFVDDWKQREKVKK